MPSPNRSGSLAGIIDRDQHAFRASMTRESSRFLDEQSTILAGISVESLALLDAIRLLTDGGKRMRALLCYWGWRAAGGSPAARSVVTAGIALEFFQAAALIHDDLIDRSDTRRGAPSVHRQFSIRHRAAHWHLDPDRFGASSAILAGDLCLTFSEELFTAACDGLDCAGARPIFNRMRTEVMAGQYLDLLEEAVGPDQTPDVAAERALNILRFKSAKYSMERPLMLGGALAGAEPGLLEAFSSFALPLGEAFQLRDDVLGVFGDPAITGKPAGDDLREGKRTYLIARTLGASDAGGRDTVNRLLGRPDLRDADVAELRSRIEDSGALAHTEQLIARRSADAFLALEGLTIDELSAAALRALAEAAVTRSF
ncbi:polyprenyl synthetase family protein [Arthrobacter sp. Br18]|uniref:polyprenyl synthetase family protein n=1 Tax=Arthrobacter sp. Br18 TaxID=1312954 RepID=UPI00068437C9|nr:polyprenyl synthetase family protein [Arthrobacter sp. Br18]